LIDGVQAPGQEVFLSSSLTKESVFKPALRFAGRGSLQAPIIYSKDVRCGREGQLKKSADPPLAGLEGFNPTGSLSQTSLIRLVNR
jgi:hypothetical protein